MVLPPSDIVLRDGESVVVTIFDEGAVSVSPAQRGGMSYAVQVQVEGVPYVLRGGTRLWRALYPILIRATWPCRVRVTAIGAPGTTSRDWTVIPA